MRHDSMLRSLNFPHFLDRRLAYGMRPQVWHALMFFSNAVVYCHLAPEGLDCRTWLLRKEYLALPSLAVACCLIQYGQSLPRDESPSRNPRHSTLLISIWDKMRDGV